MFVGGRELLVPLAAVSKKRIAGKYVFVVDSDVTENDPENINNLAPNVTLSSSELTNMKPLEALFGFLRPR